MELVTVTPQSLGLTGANGQAASYASGGYPAPPAQGYAQTSYPQVKADYSLQGLPTQFNNGSSGSTTSPWAQPPDFYQALQPPGSSQPSPPQFGNDRFHKNSGTSTNPQFGCTPLMGLECCCGCLALPVIAGGIGGLVHRIRNRNS